MEKDNRLVVLLGDIGVFSFQNVFSRFPDRIYNIGILEQSTIGMASGLAMEGFIPIVHTIAPFLVERAYEQLKDDFGYQKLSGKFVSAGASYDYSALGSTHHCPADVPVLKQIPEMEIVLPGTGEEFDSLFKETYANGHPTYFRLSENKNDASFPVAFGKANVVKQGKKATVIAVGPMLKNVLTACKDEDVTILYYTTVSPFDKETLHENFVGDKVILCEPYYSGALAFDVASALSDKKVETHFIGVPLEFLRNYGKAEDQDNFLGLTEEAIGIKIRKISI